MKKNSKRKDKTAANPDATAEPSTLDLGLAGATSRNLGFGSTGGQSPVSPGRSAGSMGISSELAYMAGVTGTGLTQSGTLTGEIEEEGILNEENPPFDDTAGLSATEEAPDRGAQVAGTAGGASAGANDKAVGDYESATRPDNARRRSAPHYNLDEGRFDESDEDDDEIVESDEEIAATMRNVSGATSGSTTGGSVDTDADSGSGGVILTGGASGPSASPPAGGTATQEEDAEE